MVTTTGIATNSFTRECGTARLDLPPRGSDHAAFWHMATSTSRRPSDPKEPKDLVRFRTLRSEAPEPHFYVVLLGLRTLDWTSLIRAVERGFAYETIENLQRNTGIATDTLLGWLQISTRTLARRKQQGRFDMEESDRLLRASRIFGRALELFEGDRDAAVEWMFSPQPALGGETPIEIARTELGSREVENLAGRIEHGVYS
jgi:putative toxin-antitoxin system antitoxin component (TIGR02293 family)